MLEEKVERQPEQLAQRGSAPGPLPHLNISSTEKQVSGNLFAQVVATVEQADLANFFPMFAICLAELHELP